MISRDQLALAIAFLRCEAEATEEDIVEEAGLLGLDPEPIVLLVLRRAPKLDFAFERGEPVFRKGTTFADIRTSNIWLGTRALLEALAIVREFGPPVRLQTRYEGNA